MFYIGTYLAVWPDGQMVCSILDIYNDEYLPNMQHNK